MRINSNISSLMAQGQLVRTTRSISRALSHLASGSRITEARDDASGLAMANSLEAQQRGLTQVVRNMNDAMSMLTTADQSISSLLDLTQRMKELALQSSNGTLSSTDREYLNDEFQTLLEEYSRIVDSTEFNGLKILAGSADELELQVGLDKGQAISLDLSSVESSNIFQTENGNGTFTLGSTSMIDSTATNVSIQVADLDDDGNNDLIQREGTYLTVRWGDGNGSWSSISTLYTTAASSRSNDPFVEDIDGDGRLDLLVKDATSIAKLTNLGSRNFSSASVQVLDGTGITAQQMADLNGDGNLDLMTIFKNGLNYYAGTYLGDGVGNFILSTSLNVGPTPSNDVDLGDLDGDGDVDAMVQYGIGSYRILYNAGAGSFSTSATNITAPLMAAATDIELEDIDSDGDLDFITNQSVNTYVYRNEGSGNMTRIQDLSGVATVGISLGDIDGDGYMDLAMTEGSANKVTFYKGRYGGMDLWSSMTTLTTPIANGLGDFDGDGILDLFIAHTGSDQLAYYRGNTEFNAAEASDLNILNQSASQDVLTILDRALVNLTERRTQIGAQLNRLEFGQNEAMMRKENLQSAKSQLMDVDIAEETAELARSQILQQAQISVLSQANLSLRTVLDLLRYL